MIKSFRKQHTLNERISECNRILSRHPGRVPVILECSKELDGIIEKRKYLVPKDISVSSLPYIIRNRSKINSNKSIILFVNDKIPKAHSLVGELYEEYLDSINNKRESEDKFLYIYVAYESTFG